jgi:predicted transcriptional regulator
MKFDSTQHNPEPAYLRSLIEKAGLTQAEAARRLGIGARQMRYYLTDSKWKMPYNIQFCLETIAEETASHDPVTVK